MHINKGLDVFIMSITIEISIISLKWLSVLFYFWHLKLVTSGLVRYQATGYPFSLSCIHFTFMRREIASKHADIRKDSWVMSLKYYWFSATFFILYSTDFTFNIFKIIILKPWGQVAVFRIVNWTIVMFVLCWLCSPFLC